MADLARLVHQHLQVARTSDHGRSAELILHDGPLRQTIIALVAGSELPEHNAPPAASLQVLVGRVQVSGQDVPEAPAGHLTLITHERHGVMALEDTVFLLTTVTGVDHPTGEPERSR